MLKHNVVCVRCKGLFQIDDSEAERLMIHEDHPDCGCDPEKDEDDRRDHEAEIN